MDHRRCSGLYVISFGAMKIESGRGEIVIAGGVESMSTGKFHVPDDIKWGIGRDINISFLIFPR
ncbi:MAG: hypothetical protein MUP27_01680 [Desulfobacterales bacterium]|nr:hypothetical protein [Desulfobacterales bacterium]